MRGATVEEVADAHRQDLEVQDRVGVKFLSYWFDYDRNSAFCLVKSSDADRVKEVYQVAHGMLPSDIIPGDRVTVEMFLGPDCGPGGVRRGTLVVPGGHVHVHGGFD